MSFSPRPPSPTTSSARFPHRAQPLWDTSAEILASSMMLVTIAEEQSTNVGYFRSNRGLKRSSQDGWGSAMSRKSVKTNLSMLGSSDCSMDSVVVVSPDDEVENAHNAYFQTQHAASGNADEWGFFIDAP